MSVPTEPVTPDSPGQRFVHDVAGALLRKLLIPNEARGMFQREILERHEIESMSVAIEPPGATFSLRVRDRRATDRHGTANMVVPWALEHDGARPELAEVLVDDFMAELDEDVMSTPSGKPNVLRWDE